MASRALAISILLMTTLLVAAKPMRPNDDNLLQVFAKFRRTQIQNVDYNLHFTLNKNSETFDGKATLSVDLAKTDAPLSIDFVAKKINSVKVNGAEVKDYLQLKGSIDIPKKYLAKKTVIEIEYTSEFNKEGHGFQRSVDPVDKAEYLYTDFEPYYAHLLFPSFDQPDIKAVFKLTVDAPKDWRVIGNELIENATTTKDRTVTTFVKTPPLSTYLFFVGAGPYVEWKDTHGNTPLYIWARKSLEKYVDHRRLFETTKKGLTFFNDYFGYPMPFSKYGQIFVPEFSWGGMENPGAVTLNERNIYRGPVSTATLLGRDNLILHEMAHMWFGDLVTMKWWDDLWLNESFASYLATVAQDRGVKAYGAWQDFFSDKNWGYWQDQLVTTHPIESQVPDVRTTKGNFDGITYAKGAASLKQLHFFVGEEGFREGLRNYFSKYAFKNTIREQFISEIASASKQDLKPWTKAWLQTSGPHRVSVKWTCKDGKVDVANIVQLPNVSKIYSPHRTRVGFYKIEDGQVRVIETKEVSYSKANTPIEGVQTISCPDFVYPNVDDQDYALFSLDPVSLKNVKDVLAAGDPLLRLMLWSTLSQMVRDNQLAALTYFDYTMAGLEKENDEINLGILLGRHSTMRSYYYGYLTKEQRDQLAPKLEELVLKRLSTAPSKSSAQIVFYDYFVSIAQTPSAMAKISGFLNGKEIPKGIEVDQDRRWKIVDQLASNGAADAEAIIAAEEKRDTTTAGQRNAYGARAAIPRADVKDKYWAQFQKPQDIPHSNLREATGSFHNPNHPELSGAFTKKFFENVKKMDWAANDSLVDIYFENLFPGVICSKELLGESRKQLQAAKNLTPLAKRAWLEQNDELSKCVSVRSESKSKSVLK